MLGRLRQENHKSEPGLGSLGIDETLSQKIKKEEAGPAIQYKGPGPISNTHNK